MIPVLLAALLAAQGEPKRMPAPGIPVPEAERKEIADGLAELDRAVEAIQGADLRADVEIYRKAVRSALDHNEFFDPKEFKTAKAFLKQGLDRAAEVRAGKASWAAATGLVARGYVSKIDGSVQPYGLVVPASYAPGAKTKHRLDVWLHGRDEKLTELRFIDARQKSAGEFTPPDTFVLHAYGRYCNAFKLAGEVDVLEAMEDAKKRYPIDEQRLVIRGFSMGGGGCWHLAVHYAGMWAAAAPGAGFAETARFQKIDPASVSEIQRTLWHLYDATDWAANLFNCPTVAYSGEVDKQKQAADVMAEALKAEGMELTHIIGPGTAHKYHPESKVEISRRIDAFAASGKSWGDRIRFTTWTLRYNRMGPITVDALEKHWDRARVELGADRKVKTENVAALTLARPVAEIDGQAVTGRSFRKVDGKWTAGAADDGELLKRHGLQGPIDDAFMDSFIMVRPTGKPLHEKTGAWTAARMDRAVKLWNRFFRGDARVVDDDKVGAAEIAAHNLVLWGDPGSNGVLAKIIDKLPFREAWSAGRLPVFIFPNPLNPKRYVVVNSGFTFMDQTAVSNALHIPVLPDWAILDISGEAHQVLSSGFFGESWETKH